MEAGMEAHAPWRDEVFARLGEGIVVHASDGRILDCNPAAERILGLTQDRIAGRTSLDPRWAAVHEDGSPFPGDTHPAMVALATGEAVRNVVMGVHRPDGTYAWILVNAVPLTVAPGSEAAVAASFTDITGEMDRAARTLKATVDSMLDPHVLFQAIRDEDGTPVDVRFAEANDAAIAYVRRPRDEVIGSPLKQLFEQRAATMVLNWVLEVLITGTPFARDDVPLPMSLEGHPRRLDIRAVRVGEFVSFTWRDVTERGRAAQLLSTSEEMFRTAMEAAVTGMAIMDLEGRFRVVNEALCEILQLDEGSALRTSLLDLIPAEFLDEVRRERERLVTGRLSRSVLQVQLRRADGSVVWVQIGTGLIRDSNGEPRMFLAQVEDVSGEREAREQLAYQAFHDSLTGLRNRTWLLDMLDVELRAAKRSGSRLGVMFVDLDNFKVVNDSLGHAAGDEVLKAVAHRIRRVVRPRDHAGRFGGDEFVVVVTELMQAKHMERVAQRVSEAVAQETIVDNHRLIPSASIGISVSNPDSTSDSLLRDADAALFRAKDAGRARWQFFDEQMHSQAVSRMTMELQIRQGLDAGEFLVHYQPVVDLEGGRPVGFEALARWQHPKRGLLNAGEFIPVAEETGLIVPLGETVADHVAAMVARRSDLPGPVSINVSAVQFAAPGWADGFLTTLERHGTDPARIVLEVTETAVLSLLDSATRDLRALRELGVGVHVDDFGTGFSSISLLRDWPVTGLKLDGSFVRNLTMSDSPSNALAAGLAGLAHGLDLVAIAEGIETAEQARILAAQGWTQGQGYYFGRPGPLP
jgi:diguanylate cyclase (GGDEF)-like protein/PAS domain S-box-containing protein